MGQAACDWDSLPHTQRRGASKERAQNKRGSQNVRRVSWSHNSTEFLLGHPLKSMVRGVVGQERKSNTIHDMAVNFQEEV